MDWKILPSYLQVLPDVTFLENRLIAVPSESRDSAQTALLFELFHLSPVVVSAKLLPIAETVVYHKTAGVGQ